MKTTNKIGRYGAKLLQLPKKTHFNCWMHLLLNYSLPEKMRRPTAAGLCSLHPIQVDEGLKCGYFHVFLMHLSIDLTVLIKHKKDSGEKCLNFWFVCFCLFCFCFIYKALRKTSFQAIIG